MRQKKPTKKVVRELAHFFWRSGYVRFQNTERLLLEGHTRYKKGDEVRVTVRSDEELAELRALLESGGFKPGRAFLKHGLHCQPVYGRDEVRRFLGLIAMQEEVEEQARAAAAERAKKARAAKKKPARPPRRRSA
jgi:hypothetical protein